MKSLGRRKFLHGLTAAGAATLLRGHCAQAAAEPPPETTRLTLRRVESLCQAPQYIAKALLEAEGFTDVRHPETPNVRGGAYVEDRSLASGEVQMTMDFVGPLLVRLDAGDPIVVLSGGHVGCLELFAHDSVRGVRDLKGKTIAMFARAPHVFLVTVTAHVGLDQRKDVEIRWLDQPEARRAFEERRVDAFIASPPAAQELRAKGIGRVIVNSTTDRPWSQYFCCVVAAHRDWVRKHPIATKRALRAILKSTDLCGLEPDRTARSLVEQGFTKNYDYALQAMKDVPYAKWRDYDPEDSMRFYALRLHEAGMIKSSPQKLIAQGSDWRFMNELKKELKG